MDERVRLASLFDRCQAPLALIRQGPTAGAGATKALRFAALNPAVTTVWNSAIPVSMNDGGLWAGRGATIGVSAGFSASMGKLSLVVAPIVTSAANRPFPILPSDVGVWSPYASPWRSAQISGDMPLRFGNARYTRILPGETTLELATRRVAIGASSSAMWWGPGIHNALLVSNNAAGIPRVFVRTPRPLVSRLGAFEGYVMLGGLTESPFFDRDVRNDLRFVSAAAFTLRPAIDTTLTLGIARTVYGHVRRASWIPGHFADVFIDWHRTGSLGRVTDRRDQITSLFGRWVVSSSGLAVHAEWAKLQPPSSLREVLVEPQRRQGYTLGLEWAGRLDSGTTIRFQAEATSLEQTPRAAGEETSQFYASHSVPQGFTQHGQVIGATIGPGSSSQHLGVALFRPDWHAGVVLGRIRWSEDAYHTYRSRGGFGYKAHDVSLFTRLNASHDAPWLRTEVAVTKTWRLNYLFQTAHPYLFGDEFDVHNTTLSLSLTPRLRRP